MKHAGPETLDRIEGFADARGSSNEGVRAPRRPLHATAGFMTAVHQLVELAFGTGVIGQSAVGLVPAIAASTVLDGGWVILAGRRRSDPVLAFLAGIGLGVPAIHFLLWPWRFRGLPLSPRPKVSPAG